MHISLAGRTALVTGSTAGIGHAVAVAMARAGATLVVNGRTPETVELAAQRLLEQVPEAVEPRRAVGDVGTASGAEAIFRAAPDVDILVNNAVKFVEGQISQSSDDDFESTFAVNVMGGVRLSRFYASGMRERRWGRIIFVSSDAALQTRTGMVPYSVTKTAQLAFARGMAQELAETGVTVNSVLPGATGTEQFLEMLQAEIAAGRAADLDEAGRAYVKQHAPSLLGRITTPEEVAHIFVFLASELSLATNGAAIRAEGGSISTL